MAFSIDDVRESFATDVTHMLAVLEDSARGLHEHPLMQLDGDDRPVLLGAIAQSSHSIVGTCALVEVTSMARTAERVERMARAAEADLRTAAQLIEGVRRVAGLCRDVRAALGAMLALELEGRSEEALAIATSIWQQLDAPQVDAGEQDGDDHDVGAEEMSVADAPAAPQVTPGGLLGIFRLEAAGEVEVLFAALDALARSPGDRNAAACAEEALEAIRGAASLIGLTDVGELAAAGQARLEAALDGRDIATFELATSLLAIARELARIAGLPVAEPAAAATPAPSPELAAIFREDAAATLDELGAVLDRLGQGTAEPSDVEVAERSFHTLKGSAAIVGLSAVAAIAGAAQARLDEVLAGTVELGTEELQRLRDAHREILALASDVAPGSASLDDGWDESDPRTSEPAAASSEAAPASAIPVELLAIFRHDATDSLRELGDRLRRLAEVPTSTELLEDVERVFHSLKGAAAIVGLDELAETAKQMQERFDAVLSGRTAPTADLLVAAVHAMRRIVSAAALDLELVPGELLELPAEPLPIVVESAPPSWRESSAPPAHDDSRIGELRAMFVTELLELTDEVARRLPAVTTSSRERARTTIAEIGHLVHRLKGSALLVGEREIGHEAATLQAMCESEASGPSLASALSRGVARLRTLAGAAPASTPLTPIAGPDREAVELRVDPQLWAAFVQECDELLDASDRLILELERSDRPKDVIESLLRQYHTLKGAVNAIGLAPTGRALHGVEDCLESLLEAPLLPAMSALATLLFDVQHLVRRHLDQARGGSVEIDRRQLELRIASLLGQSPSQAIDSSLRGSRRSTGSELDGLPGYDGTSQLERRTLRVPTERLDTLMNLAGELVVSRSRLVSRVRLLRGLHGELERSRHRLVTAIEGFHERHEFTVRRGAGGRPRRLPAGSSLDVATQTVADWTQFSELELDRYDDINVLSRSLAEITDDVSEMDRQLTQQLALFGDDTESMSSIVTSIQGEVTRARMVPVETLFTRLRLPVRDAAERERKQVRVVTVGEDVDVDKTIIDALFAPLLHLVRNAVSHGIETPAVRTAAGKAAEGTITLHARQESGQIVVEIRDDGDGLDLAKLHALGVRSGTLPAGCAVDDPAVVELVFAHGVSTRDTAEDVAGRGVGGDVVKRSIERLNGTVRVETHPGAGTVFTIRLPVTLAITRAIVVALGERTFAIPLYFAERLVDVHQARIADSAGLRRMRVDDGFVPLRGLDEIVAGDPARGPILMLRLGDQVLALQVDRVVGQEEIVVKDLGELLSGHPLFAGMTIRGTGEVVLILDVPGLFGTDTDAARAAPARRPAPRIEAPIAVVEDTSRARVLWVDDSLSVRKVAEKTLLALGVDVDLAVDGLDALQKLRATRYDLVFTDLEMPRMNGYELMREIRYVPGFRELPLVVVSSRSAQKHREQARIAGATEFVTKPFTADTLAALIARLSGKRPRSPS